MRVLFLTVCLDLAQAVLNVDDKHTCSLPDTATCASRKRGDRQFIQFKRNKTLHEQPLVAEDAVDRSTSADGRSVGSNSGVELQWRGQREELALPGVLHVVNGSEQEAEKDDCSFLTAPPCEQMVTHTCAKVGKLPNFCPEACSYVVVDPLFHCEAACVLPTKCYEGGVGTTYGNPATHLCEEPPIQGCRQFGPHDKGKLPKTCQECSDGFSLQDGSCVFLPIYRQLAFVGFICFAAVVVVLLPLNLYRWCVLPVGNPGAVNHGFSRQQQSVATQDNYKFFWNYLDPTLQMELYPLSTNMRKTQIAGPGFNLYYRHLVFLLIAALILAVATSLLYYLNPFRTAGLEREETCQVEKFGLAAKESFDSSKMYAYSFCALWILLLLCSLLYARNQHLSFRELRRDHHLMSDFGTKVEGFPPDADETEIKSFFDQIAPDTVAAVSLAYDYREHVDTVNKLLAKHHLAEEVAQSFRPPENDMDNPIDRDKEAIKHMLMSLKGSGIVFSVSDSKQSRNKFIEAFEAERPLFRGRWRLEMRLAKAEPTTFFWVNFPYSRKYHWIHGGLEICIVLLEASVLAGVLFLPAAYFLYNWSRATGIGSTDLESTVICMMMGLPIIGLNAILQMLVNRSCKRIGLYYKTDIDRCNLIGCVLIVGLLTAFNLVLVLETIQAANHSIDHELLKSQPAVQHRLREESINKSASEEIYAMLVPGVLILPDTLIRFVKFACTPHALFNYLASIPFYKRDMRSNVDLTFREAEEGLQLNRMQIEFDYAGSICVFGTAFFILSFPGYCPVLTCWILVAWAVMSYGIQTLCHLRFAKLTPYTSFCLDDCATYLWGIPVSLLAGVSVHWARKAQVDWSWEASVLYPEFIASVAAFILYCVLITIVFECVSEYNDHVADDGGGDYAKSASRLRYDYFNTNPVHVLKTMYLDGYGQPLVYFRRGKEHLQSKFVKKDPNYKKFMSRASISLDSLDS